MKKTNKKQIPKVRLPKYSPGGKFGKGLKDTGLFLADTALAEWAPNVISQDQYSDSPYGKNLGKVASIHESFDSQSPIRKNVSKYWTDNKSSGMNEEEQSLFNSVQPIAKTGSKIGEMWTGSALGGIGAGAGSKATGFGKNLGKVSEMGTKDYNPNVYNENQVQNQAQIESQNQTAMSGLNDARRNSMTPNGNMYARYGGQMKFAMGGMNIQPNAEVEGDEMITSNVKPQVFNNGGVELASNNPYGTPTYKTNGASHENGGIPMNMAPGSIINGKTRNPLTGNKFTKDVDIIAKMENKYTKKAESGDKYSNTNAKLILPILAQKKDYLNNLQNAIIANNKQRKALNRGELPQPSRDNESMEPQGISEQSEGEMPMARYGGRFAMGGMQQYAMGGVQLPYYNTDSNGNPKYGMGGFNDGEPLTSVNTSTIINAKKVDTIPTNYTKIGTQGSRTYYDLPSDKAKVNPAGGKVSSDWENSIIKRLEGGTSAQSLVDAGHISPSQIDKYNKYYKPLYTETQSKNTFTQPSTTLPINQKIALKDENRIDRKSVFTGAPYNTFQYPDVNAGYSKATTRYFDPKTNQEIDASKSFDPKGNYVPSYLSNPTGGVEGTLKETRYNTPIGSTTDNPTLKSGTKDAGTTGFKYGGKMPKYVLGGEEDSDNGLGYTPNNPAEAYRMQQAAKMNALANKKYSQKSSYSPNVLPWEKTNDSENTPNNPYVNSKVNPYDNIDAADRKAEREAREAAEMNGTGSGTPPMNNIDWSKTDKFGNLVNFIGQNAGNIYDLSRKNEPLQSYARTKASLITPDFRDANQKYLWAKEALGNASGGSAGAFLANIQKAHVDNVMNRAQIQQTADNTNAQIGNQVNQFNTEIAYREAEARAKDAAMKENVRSQAVHNIAESTGKLSLSNKQDLSDENTLNAIGEYYNTPEFKAFMKRTTWGSKKSTKKSTKKSGK